MSEAGGAQSGEVEVLRTRPGLAFVALYRPVLLIPALLALLAYLALAALPVDAAPARLPAMLFWFAALSALAYLLWGFLEWLSRRYVLTSGRITVDAGVISRVAADVPLRNVQHVTMSQSVLERVLGLGTIGAATAGSDGAAVHWLMVPAPHRTMASVRREVERVQGSGVRGQESGVRSQGSERAPSTSPPHLPTSPPPHALTPSPPPRPVIIGLAGGIGAGKSEVARILADLGCVVTDSDAEARVALDRPDVRSRLVEWWGPGVVGPDGHVDRGAVAKIVFADPAQRTRLEALVHPLVKQSRAEAIRRAREDRARAVVIDAPLLFEAGVDAECDAVIFVEAPHEVRLERVRATRGWDEAELARREAAQLPAYEKRRRSHEVLVNAGSEGALREAVSGALGRILARAGSEAKPRTGPAQGGVLESSDPR